MENKTYNLVKIQDLSHGENPHQSANLYKIEDEVLDYELLNGLDLTYNNILNSTVALELSSEFFDVAAITIVKHTNPNVVALGKNLINALEKALDCDPISIFNSTVCFTREVEVELAKKLKEFKIEILIAPSYSKEALEVLKENKLLKIVKANTPLREISKFYNEEIKITPFGVLVQQKDTKDLDVSTFKVVTKKKPSQNNVEDMIFAFKVAKHSKSSCAVVAKDLRTVGIANSLGDSAGAIEMALSKVCDSPKDCVIALDKSIDSVASIQIALQQRISGIIQPMGNIEDKKIIQCADKYDISMISTGINHIKH